MNNLPKLRAAIIKAVPEIAEQAGSITLADVLRVMQSKYGHNVGATGGSRNDEIAICKDTDIQDNFFCFWNLTKDLDDQSPETIDFLTSVLCNE